MTPADLIEGIITDKGLLPKKNNVFDVPAFMQSQVTSAVSYETTYITTYMSYIHELHT